MKEPGDFIVEFIADVLIDGMIHAFTIRSPIARGRLLGIECPKLPDSYHLITSADIPGKNKLSDFTLPVLASGELSYIGQPVAILAGPDEYMLEELSSSVNISAEEEKAVFIDSEYGQDDVFLRRNISRGEPSAELAAEPSAEPSGEPSGEQNSGLNFIEGTFITGIQEHWYSVPHGAIAIIDPELLIITTTQWPYHVKRSVAALLGLEKVNVQATKITSHMDGKIWYPSLIACHAALAATVTGKPVKLMLTREEDFMYSPKRNGSKIRIKTGIGEKGEIKSSEIQITLDLGAQGVFRDEIIDQTCLGALGIYNHKTFKIDAAGIRTNIPPQGPMVGFGLSQGFFAAERQASLIADSLGQDPAEWRKKNVLFKNKGVSGGKEFSIGIGIKENTALPELIDRAAFISDYYRKWASYELLRSRRREEKVFFSREPLRGIGIALAFQGNGLLYSDEYGAANSMVEMTLEKDGSLEIRTSIVSSLSGFMDTWSILAHEMLGVDPSMVKLAGNTEDAPDSGPGTLSRNIGSVTKLVERCITAIKNQRFRDPLPIKVRRSSRSGKSLGWVEGKNIDPDVFAWPAWGAAVVETEIDPVSFEPQIRGVWLTVDGGRILNERRARRTLKTGIIQALGWACREHLSYNDGRIDREYYLGYDIPSPGWNPPITVDFFNNESTNPKGIGELPFSCVPAAFAQAVSQSIDYHFEKIPLDNLEIWKALRSKNMQSKALQSKKTEPQ